MKTFLLRQNDVATSFWRSNYVIFASLLRRVCNSWFRLHEDQLIVGNHLVKNPHPPHPREYENKYHKSFCTGSIGAIEYMVDINYLYETVYSVYSCFTYHTDLSPFHYHFGWVILARFEDRSIIVMSQWLPGISQRTLPWQWYATVLANKGKFEANIMHVHARICTSLVNCVRNSTASIGYDMRCNGMRNRFSPRGVVCFISHRWRNSDPNIASNSYLFQICCSMEFLNFEDIQAIYTCDYFFYISTEYCRYTVAICL